MANDTQIKPINSSQIHLLLQVTQVITGDTPVQLFVRYLTPAVTTVLHLLRLLPQSRRQRRSPQNCCRRCRLADIPHRPNKNYK